MSNPTKLPSPATQDPDARPAAKPRGNAFHDDYTPNKTEYIAASDAAYGISQGTFSSPQGLTTIKVSDPAKMNDGFAAVAFRDFNGNIIIANEGTIPGPSILTKNNFDRDSLLADNDIQSGKTAAALKDAVAFTKEVQKEFPGGKIYVTGHSLGGIEAEAEAKALNPEDKHTRFGGGMVFGATGLPGNTEAGPQNLVIKVDYGDMVGNFSSDANSPLRSIAPKDMFHYGRVEMEGNPVDAVNLEHLARDKLAAQNAVSGWGVLSPVNLGMGAGFFGVAAKDALQSVSNSHPIANYGHDIHADPKAAPVYTFQADDIRTHLTTYGEKLRNVNMTAAPHDMASNNGLASPDPVTNAALLQQKLKGIA